MFHVGDDVEGNFSLINPRSGQYAPLPTDESGGPLVGMNIEEMQPQPTTYRARANECSQVLAKDAYHFYDFVMDVRVAYVYHYMKNDLIRKLAIVQTVHLASCAIFNMLAYLFVKPMLQSSKGPEHERISALYDRIWADPNMRVLEFFNFLLSMTGLEHHSVLIAWHGTLYPHHGPLFKSLERRLDKWAACLKLYECGIQTPLQVTILAIQICIGQQVDFSQKISVVTSTIAFTLSSLGDVIASIVEDPDNPGYMPENAFNYDERNWSAIDNLWSADSSLTSLQIVIDLVLVANVGVTIWIWLKFESVWTKGLWVSIVFIMFAMHIMAHADYLQRNRKQLKHLLGHKIFLNRGAFVMLLSFISPFAFRLYNPISNKTNGGFPHLISLCFYMLIVSGYSWAVWWDYFAVDTLALLVGGGLSFVGLASALWWTKQDCQEISRLGEDSKIDEHPKCVPDTTKKKSLGIFFGLFLGLGVSATLPFYVHIGEHDMANFVIEEFGGPIAGEYYKAGMHNRKAYFKKRGDIWNLEPVIYWVPPRDAEFGHSKWVIGVCKQPFEPSFDFSSISVWHLWEFTISALSESPRPVCDPHMQKRTNDGQTCFAYTTNDSLPSMTNHAGISALWHKLDRYANVYRVEAVRMSSPAHYGRITLTGMDRASLAKTQHLVLGEYEADDMNAFNSFIGTDGGKRSSKEYFREGFPVFKQKICWNSSVSVHVQSRQAYHLFVFNGKWSIDKHIPGPANADEFDPAVQVHGDLLSNISNHSELFLSTSRHDSAHGHHAIAFLGSCDSKCRGCFGGKVQQCISCVDGYFGPPCALKRCTCIHGVGEIGKSCPRHGVEHCKSCKNGAYKNGSRCALKRCTCKNGFGEYGTECASNGNEQCKSCKENFKKVAHNCVAYPCTTGNGAKCKICKPKSLRTGDNQCQICNRGYELMSTTSLCRLAACNQSVYVDGASSVLYSSMGLFTITNDTKEGRPVYRNHQSSYLFHRKGYWTISDEIDTDGGWVFSMRGNGALCPEDVRRWKAYDTDRKRHIVGSGFVTVKHEAVACEQSVIVDGAGGSWAALNGLFRKTNHTSDGRPVYKKSIPYKSHVFHKNGGWLIGKKVANAGWLLSKGGDWALCPKDVHHWKWNTRRGVGTVTVKNKAVACDQYVIVDGAGGSLATMMGLFQKTSHTSEGRPVYKKSFPYKAYVFHKASTWLIGDRIANAGWLRSHGGDWALCPEDVHRWKWLVSYGAGTVTVKRQQ